MTSIPTTGPISYSNLLSIFGGTIPFSTRTLINNNPTLFQAGRFTLSGYRGVSFITFLPLWNASISGASGILDLIYPATSFITQDNGNYLVGYYDQSTVSFYNTSGSIISTLGTLSTNGAINSILAKYNSSGGFQWSTLIRSNSTLRAVATGIDGSAYIGGSYNTTQVIYYNANRSIAATCSNAGVPNITSIFAKYTSVGNFQWAVPISGQLIDKGISIANDTSVWVCGVYSATQANFYNTSGQAIIATIGNDGQVATYISRFSSTGSLLSATRIDGIGNESLGHISASADNGSFIAGKSSSTQVIFYKGATIVGSISLASQAGIVAKYAQSGLYNWSFRIDGNDPGQSTQIFVASVSDNSVFVTGYSTATQLSFYNINGSLASTIGSTSGSIGFLSKYSSTGSLQWVNKIGEFLQIRSISTSNDDGAWISGFNILSNTVINFYATNGSIVNSIGNNISGSMAFIAKYNSIGNLIYKSFSKSGSVNYSISTTAIPDGVLIGGQYQNTLDFYDNNGNISSSATSIVGTSSILYKYKII